MIDSAFDGEPSEAVGEAMMVHGNHTIADPHLAPTADEVGE
jgi:hypothetical protein